MFHVITYYIILQLLCFERLRPSQSKPPRFYGLPKIHKPNTPLRPIVSAIGSPTYSLAKFVTTIISPLTGKTLSHVKNAKHFTEMISEETVDGDEVMVSFDVQSLFTNVPVDQALDVIHDKLSKDETLGDRTPLTPQQITNLLHTCLRATYFLYHGSYYEQTDGTAMGSPVSPVVANIFMEHIEESALATSPQPIRFWRRYVDDTFCFLKKSTVDEALQHLNSINPSIQFTVEQETDNQLPFLDVLLMRDDNNKIRTTVYRKKTHTDRYLSFKSHHSAQAKRSTVMTLLKRARDVTSDRHLLKKELKHLQGVMLNNDYPTGFLKRCRTLKPKERSEDEHKPLSTTKLPYIEGLSEEIRRILRGFNIRTVFRTIDTLGRILTRVKDPTPPEERPGVIYKIKCICGDFYVGETKRTLATRIKEHKAACRLGAFERSAVAEHAWQEGHEINWDDVEILDTAKDLQERKVKESLYIRMVPRTCLMNRDEGRELPSLWMRTIRNAKKRERLQPRPPRTPRPSVTRTLAGVTRCRDLSARAQRTPHPPATPPPAVRRPTPTFRRASTTPTRASDTPTN